MRNYPGTRPQLYWSLQGALHPTLLSSELSCVELASQAGLGVEAGKEDDIERLRASEACREELPTAPSLLPLYCISLQLECFKILFASFAVA